MSEQQNDEITQASDRSAGSVISQLIGTFVGPQITQLYQTEVDENGNSTQIQIGNRVTVSFTPGVGEYTQSVQVYRNVHTNQNPGDDELLGEADYTGATGNQEHYTFEDWSWTTPGPNQTTKYKVRFETVLWVSQSTAYKP